MNKKLVFFSIERNLQEDRNYEDKIDRLESAFEEHETYELPHVGEEIRFALEKESIAESFIVTKVVRTLVSSDAVYESYWVDLKTI